jgi:hypothetical protein
MRAGVPPCAFEILYLSKSTIWIQVNVHCSDCFGSCAGRWTASLLATSAKTWWRAQKLACMGPMAPQVSREMATWSFPGFKCAWCIRWMVCRAVVDCRALEARAGEGPPKEVL